MGEPLQTFDEETRRRDRPPALRITLGVVGALLGLLLVFAMLLGMLSLGPGAPNVPAGPPDKPTPEQVLRDVRAHERRLLTTYGWVDREKGVVRIPIDVAIEKMIEEHSGGR